MWPITARGLEWGVPPWWSQSSTASRGHQVADAAARMTARRYLPTCRRKRNGTFDESFCRTHWSAATVNYRPRPGRLARRAAREGPWSPARPPRRQLHPARDPEGAQPVGPVGAELVEFLGRAIGVDGSPAQVSARYIAGLPKVNHRVYKKPWQNRITRRPDIRLWRSVAIFSAFPGTGARLACSHPSRGYYRTYRPLGHVTVAMFARCLLGCRGTI
jgi:hypothetical protein